MKKLNIIHWLILSSILLSLASCSNIRSVRHGKITEAKSEKNREIENEISTIANNDTVEQDQYQKKIPTLQEQMHAVKQDIGELNQKYDKISEDISEIKEYIKNNKKNDNVIYPDSNEESKEAITGKAPEKEKKDRYVLLPDEEADEVKDDSKENTAKPRSKKRKDLSVRKEAAATKVVKSRDLEKANKLIGEGEYNAAIIILLKEEQRISEPKLLARCKYLIGKSFLELNRYAQAKDYFTDVIDEELDYEEKAEAHSGIAKAYLKTGKVNEAKDTYKKIVDDYTGTKFVIEAKKMLQKL